MRMIAIHAQTERKRLDRSVRCAEKRRPWARKQRLRGLIRPDPAVCATAGAACGRKSLSSARIQAIFTSNDTPLGECRLKESLPATPYAVRVDIWGDQWFRTTDGYGGAVIKSRAQYELIYQQEESGSLRTIIDRSTGVYETSGSLPANEDYVVITESGTCRPIIPTFPK